ncbi:hypothetical protein, partial [Cohnella sp. GbtcB17]|uniref:hypothetical protein n=1 Tax=Cohnella sp. GbtcB17 TaxID=2824762 RepID=UPI001C2F68D7
VDMRNDAKIANMALLVLDVCHVLCPYLHRYMPLSGYPIYYISRAVERQSRRTVDLKRDEKRRMPLLPAKVNMRRILNLFETSLA